MKIGKNFLTITLLSALVFSAAGHTQLRAEETKPAAKETASPKKETKEAPPVAKKSPAEAVAKVGAQAITRGELERAISVLAAQNRLPQATTPEQQKQVEAFALEQLVSAELLFQEGMKNLPKDLDKQIEFKVAQSKAKFNSPAEFEAALKGANLTEKELGDITRKDIVINNFVETVITPGIKVTDDDIKKFYDENKDKFKKDEQMRASHILCGVDANASADDKKNAKDKADDLLKKLKAGEDFAKLAKENSTCPSSAQGGDLGFFGKGQMVPAFEQAAAALKPNEISNVVETQFGYHIIKLTEKKEAEFVKLDEVKEKISDYLKGQKTQKSVQEYLTGLKSKAKIENLL